MPAGTAFNPVTTQNTAASIAAQITPQQLWQRSIDYFEGNADFWQKWEGSRERPIAVATDLSKGEGHTLTIRTGSEFSNEPKYGDEPFGLDTDFEKDLLGEWQLKVGVVHHAASINEFTEESNGLRGLLASEHPSKVGRWLGRLKTEQMDMLLRETTAAENQLIANSKTQNTLIAADGLSFNVVSTAASMLRRMGGVKANMGRAEQQMRWTFVTTSDAATILRQSGDYKTAVQQAGNKSPLNPYFTGEITDLDGIAIVERDVIDMDYDGAIGSPMNPRARLSTAITAGTSAVDLLCGATTDGSKLYTKYFEGYNYKWSDGTTYSAPGSTTRYVLVINPPNAPTDPNKIGMYSYTTGNNGIKITTVERLGSPASSARVTTLGNVTWNTGVWAGKHTDVHPVGALVIPCNANGEPIGWSYLLGQSAILRGYGKHRNHMSNENYQGDYGKKIFVRSYFGQKIRRDRAGRQPGVIKILHALHYPDLPLPVVV